MTRCCASPKGGCSRETERRHLTIEHRFKTRAEMMALFADLPEALASTVEIAERCSFRPVAAQADPAALLAGRARGSRGDEAARVAPAAPPQGSRGASTTTALRAGTTEEQYRRAACLRARRHRADELSGLFPDRRRLHPVGEVAAHPGRARPRLGRGLARRLCAHHHRPRSDPVRPHLRALPQSRARVDAGLRHRLLPEPPRRGDPLRARPLWPRPGGADHHLRQPAGARACCATSAACWKCPMGRSTSCASSCRKTRRRR